MLLEPYREPIPLDPPAAGVTMVDIADPEQAMAWFHAEYPVLLATILYAATGGFGRHAWQLAWTLLTYAHRQGR